MTPDGSLHDVVALVIDYRDPARTRTCIDSLLAAGVVRVVVWDNSEAGPKSPSDYGDAPGCEILVFGESVNLGFATGVNRGFGCILARWQSAKILLMNNDAIIATNAPARLRESLADDRVAVTFPVVLQNGRRTGWTWYHPWLGLITRRNLPGALAYGSGCCQMIDPLRAGAAPYDESYFMYGEDVALAYRLQAEGWRERLVDDVAVQHEGSASSRNGSAFYEVHLVAAHRRLARLMSAGHAGRYRVMLFLRALTLCARALVRAIRFRSWAPVRALAALR